MPTTADFVLRILSGCPVKAPDPVAFNGHWDAISALYEQYATNGSEAARRAWDAMTSADPALNELNPDERPLYPAALDLDERALRQLDAYPYSDAGQGEAFAELWRESLCYVPGIGWLIWSGQRWRNDDREAVMQYAVKAARERQKAARNRAIPEQIDESQQKSLQRKKEQHIAWADLAENRSRLINTLEMARTQATLIVAAEQFDSDPHVLGVRNGVVDLRTGLLRDSRRYEYISKSTTLPYFPDAQCPRFDRFMQEIFRNNTELIAFMQRAVGYSLTGEVSEQCFFLCCGTGANGKSTFLNVLKATAGDYAANAPFNTFEYNKQSSSGQELLDLRGRRLVLSSETNEGARLNEARVKAITGSDPITARRLYDRYSVTFVPVFKLWLAANHKPVITSDDEGMWRRVHLIPFTRSFRAEERDPVLAVTLARESVGILAWAIRGAMAWYKSGLDVPQSVLDATRVYREESDIFGLFLTECTEARQDGQAPSGALYECYNRWSERNGLYPLSTVRFGRTMEERGYEKKRTAAGRFWQGLILRKE